MTLSPLAVLALILLPTTFAFEAAVCTRASVEFSSPSLTTTLKVFAYPSPDTGYTMLELVASNYSNTDMEFYDEKYHDYFKFDGMTKVPDVNLLKLCFVKTCVYESGFGLLNGTIYMHNGFFDDSSSRCRQHNSWTRVCCENFESLDFPITEATCDAFTTETVVVNFTNNFITATFGANFTLEDNVWTGNVTKYERPSGSAYQYGIPNFGPQRYEASNLTLELSGEDTLLDVKLQLFAVPNLILAANRLITITQRRGNLYWNLHHTPTSDNSCLRSKEFAGSSLGTFVAQTALCCTHFRTNPTTLSAASVPPTTPSTSPGSCPEYRSRTTIFNNGQQAAFLQVNYTFMLRMMQLEVLNFSTPKLETGEVEAYSDDTFAQACRTFSSSPYQRCVFRMSSISTYEFYLRTSSFPDGFDMFQATERLSHFTTPPMYPCHSETNNLHGAPSASAQAKTEICCIQEPNGPEAVELLLPLTVTMNRTRKKQ